MFGPAARASTPTDADLALAFAEASLAVRQLEPPQLRLDGEPAKLVEFDSVSGASVTLRYDGRVVGRGASLGNHGFEHALSEAIQEARATLAARYPIAEDRLTVAFGPAMTIDVELAGVPAPISIQTYLDASKVLAPGIDGIAFISGERQAVSFPGEMRSARTEPSETLPGLIERALGRPGLSSLPLADVLIQAPDARVLQFSTRQIVQQSAGKPPTVLHRGGRVVSNLEDPRELRAIETPISSFLRRWPDVARAYDPIDNNFERASEQEAPIVRAMIALADPRNTPDAQTLNAAIDSLKDSGDGRGLSLYLRVLRGDDRGELRSETASLARDVGIAGMASEMPWLGFSAIELGEDVPIAAPALREFLTLAMSHQVRDADTDPQDRDLRGGIVFTSRQNPLPDWRSAQVLAFAASATSHPALVSPADQQEHFARVLDGIRFLAQLSASEAEAHAYAVPPRAIGGIRSAIWQSRMPVEASAISLRAIREARNAAKSLD